MQNNNPLSTNTHKDDQSEIAAAPTADAAPTAISRRLFPNKPNIFVLNMDEVAMDAIDYLAQVLNFHWDRGAYHGANPFEAGATTDGFTLWVDGHAYDRKLAKSYGREQIHELILEKGISSETTIRKWDEVRRPAPDSWQRGGNQPTFSWHVATKWNYLDESGHLLFQVGRMDTPTGKQIRQRRPDGEGGWAYSLNEVRRVLYMLPQVLQAQTVFFVEGEKAADFLNNKLRAAGKFGDLVATTTPMGAGNSHKTDYVKAITGRSVVVLPDNDEPGARHADDICKTCAYLATVKRIELPGLPEKGDVVDFFDAGRTLDDLFVLIESAPLLQLSVTNATIVTEEADAFSLAAGKVSEASTSAADEAFQTVTDAVSSQDGAAMPIAAVVAVAAVAAPKSPAEPAHSVAAMREAASPIRATVQPNIAQPIEASRNKRFQFHSLSAVLSWPEPQWLIQDFLVEATTSMLTAKQASFKSFIALDMALSIATGQDWQGFKVRPGSVLYIAAEGADGVKKRAAAWLEHHEIEQQPENIWFYPLPLALGDLEVATDFKLALGDLRPSFIVIDTLARCAADLEENSSRDMGKFMAGIDLLVRAHRSHVMIVHHNNKSGNYRGSTALPAAVDTHFSIDRKGDIVTLTTEKQKDAAEAAPMAFEIQKVYFPDRQHPGMELESVVLERIDQDPHPIDGQLSPLLARTLQCLIDTFEDEGATQAEWKAACKGNGVEDSNFPRTRRALVNENFVYMREKKGEMLDKAGYSALIPAEQKVVRYYPTKGTPFYPPKGSTEKPPVPEAGVSSTQEVQTHHPAVDDHSLLEQPEAAPTGSATPVDETAGGNGLRELSPEAQEASVELPPLERGGGGPQVTDSQEGVALSVGHQSNANGEFDFLWQESTLLN